jgi:hypothetical protein
MPRYELHVTDRIIAGSLQELHEIVKDIEGAYKIFVYYRANFDGYSGKVNLNIRDMREAKRMRERGVSYADIAKKFSTNPKTMSRLVRNMIENEIY